MGPDPVAGVLTGGRGEMRPHAKQMAREQGRGAGCWGAADPGAAGDPRAEGAARTHLLSDSWPPTERTRHCRRPRWVRASLGTPALPSPGRRAHSSAWHVRAGPGAGCSGRCWLGREAGGPRRPHPAPFMAVLTGLGPSRTFLFDFSTTLQGTRGLSAPFCRWESRRWRGRGRSRSALLVPTWTSW